MLSIGKLAIQLTTPLLLHKLCKLFASVARVCQRQLGFLVYWTTVQNILKHRRISKCKINISSTFLFCQFCYQTVGALWSAEVSIMSAEVPVMSVQLQLNHKINAICVFFIGLRFVCLADGWLRPVMQWLFSSVLGELLSSAWFERIKTERKWKSQELELYKNEEDFSRMKTE